MSTLFSERRDLDYPTVMKPRRFISRRDAEIYIRRVRYLISTLPEANGLETFDIQFDDRLAVWHVLPKHPPSPIR